MKSKRNSVESEEKQKSNVLTITDDGVETISNANFKALYQDICKREQKIKELVERSGMYGQAIKELEERLGKYEQEMYEIDLLIQHLRDNIPLHREIISFNRNVGQKESVEL